MNKQHGLCGFIVIAAIATAGIAAANNYTDSSTLNTTEVSGNKGSTHAHIHGSKNFALVGISFTERGGDVPCELKLFLDDLNDEPMLVGDTHTFDKHGCGNGSASTKLASFNDDRDFVHGVRVCTNSSGTRIKGIELFPVHIDASGRMTFPDRSAKVTRTNCTKWHKKVSCGSQKVAVGAQVHYSASDGYKGIALRCKKLE